MPVGVVHVGNVRMPMPQPRVLMAVRMRLTERIIGSVRMPVMRIVHMAM